MEVTTPPKQRVGQHQYALFFPLDLFESIEQRSKETGESIKRIIIRAVKKELGVEGE